MLTQRTCTRPWRRQQRLMLRARKIAAARMTMFLLPRLLLLRSLTHVRSVFERVVITAGPAGMMEAPFYAVPGRLIEWPCRR